MAFGLTYVDRVIVDPGDREATKALLVKATSTVLDMGGRARGVRQADHKTLSVPTWERTLPSWQQQEQETLTINAGRLSSLYAALKTALRTTGISLTPASDGPDTLQNLYAPEQ